MAEMIADGIQRQAFGQEMTGTGVAQGMGTAVGSVDTQVVETTAGDVVEPAGRERTEGGSEGEEHLPAPTTRARLSEVAHDGAAHFMAQGVELGAVLLGAHNRHALLDPIDILEPQPGDLTAAQTIDGEEQQDGAIADVTRLLAVGRRNQLLEVFPGRTGWQCFVAKQAGTFDRRCDCGPAPALALGIPKECSECLGAAGDRDTAPMSPLAGEEGIGILNANLREGESAVC